MSLGNATASGGQTFLKPLSRMFDSRWSGTDSRVALLFKFRRVNYGESSEVSATITETIPKGFGSDVDTGRFTTHVRDELLQPPSGFGPSVSRHG